MPQSYVCFVGLEVPLIVRIQGEAIMEKVTWQ